MLAYHHIADIADQTPAEIVTALGETVSLSYDTTAYTWSGLYDKLAIAGVSPEQMNGLESMVRALPGGIVLANSLASGGVDFSREDLQQQLAAIADSQSAEIATLLGIVQRIGRPVGPLWKKLGLDELPSIEDVQAVIDLQAKKAAIDTAIAAEQALAAPHNVAVSRLQSLKNQDTYALSLAEIEAEIATVREYPETYPAEGE